MTETLKLWEFIVGIVCFFVYAGMFYQHVRSKLQDHDKKFEACHVDTLMTEAKCNRIHEERDRVTQLQISQIQKVVDAIERNNKNSDQRWGALSSKMDIIIDRMERGGNYVPTK